MVELIVRLWRILCKKYPWAKTLFLVALGIAVGLEMATVFWRWSFARQIEILEQENRLLRSIAELNSRIGDQNCEEPLKQTERPNSIPAPGRRPSAGAPGTLQLSVADVEGGKIALRYVESAREYSRRGEEVRAIEAYVSAAEALPKTFLNRRELFPVVDLNDREARSKLLAAFQNLFAETTLERLREMTKGN